MSQSARVDELIKSAQARLDEGEIDLAIDSFREALSVNELSAPAHEGLGMAAFLTKDYAEAVKHFQRVTQLDPMQGKTWVNLGAVYNRMGEYQKAVDALRKAVQKDRKCAEGYYNLGIAYKGQNQLAMAVSAYREALRIDPQMAAAHANLANVFVDQGNFQMAISHYRQALLIRPDFERARRGLEFAENASQAAKQAISPFGRLVDADDPNRASGITYFRKLSEEERTADRHAMTQLCPELEFAANSMNKHLKEQLERTLMTLSRAIAQGQEGRATLISSADELQFVLGRCKELRRALKRKVLELQAHEEIACTPT